MAKIKNVLFEAPLTLTTYYAANLGYAALQGFGTSLDDQIEVDSDTIIYGLRGNDTITALGSGNSLYGNSGDDTLISVGGRNLLVGGYGSDALYLEDGDIAHGGQGNDLIFINGTFSTTIGGGGNDVIVVTGTSVNNSAHVIYGNAGDDTITGGAGNDYIVGGQGRDRIDAGDGDDDVSGGLGNDFIDAGRGNDYVDGGYGDDFILGGEGNDSLHGSGGDDIIDGADGDDILYGGINGTDVINGRSGNDTILIGAGPDIITGGSGSDTFSILFRAGLQLNTPASNIGDFEIAGSDFTGDRLDIRSLLDHIGHPSLLQVPLGDFLRFTYSGENSTFQIDSSFFYPTPTGNPAPNWVDLVVFKGVSLDFDGLLASGQLIVA